MVSTDGVRIQKARAWIFSQKSGESGHWRGLIILQSHLNPTSPVANCWARSDQLPGRAPLGCIFCECEGPLLLLPKCQCANCVGVGRRELDAQEAESWERRPWGPGSEMSQAPRKGRAVKEVAVHARDTEFPTSVYLFLPMTCVLHFFGTSKV